MKQPIFYDRRLSNTCEKNNLWWYNGAFRVGQKSHKLPFGIFHKFVENRAQSPTCKFKMSAVCVAERLLTARPRLSSCIKHVNVSILKLPLH